MNDNEASVVDVNRFATRFWAIAEEMHSQPASLTKYTEFDEKLWDLCLDYPDITQQTVLRIDRELGRRHGYRSELIWSKFAMNELKKIVSPKPGGSGSRATVKNCLAEEKQSAGINKSNSASDKKTVKGVLLKLLADLKGKPVSWERLSTFLGILVFGVRFFKPVVEFMTNLFGMETACACFGDRRFGSG